MKRNTAAAVDESRSVRIQVVLVMAISGEKVKFLAYRNQRLLPGDPIFGRRHRDGTDLNMSDFTKVIFRDERDRIAVGMIGVEFDEWCKIDSETVIRLHQS